jgi:hypothetical protein
LKSLSAVSLPQSLRSPPTKKSTLGVVLFNSFPILAHPFFGLVSKPCFFLALSLSPYLL